MKTRNIIILGASLIAGITLVSCSRTAPEIASLNIQPRTTTDGVLNVESAANPVCNPDAATDHEL